MKDLVQIAENRADNWWKNYWMQAPMTSLSFIIDTRERIGGRNEPIGLSERIANADLKQGWGSGVRNFERYLQDNLTMEGMPINGDINRHFDRLALRGGQAELEGLIDIQTYHEKTALDGIYMVWGPPVYQRREWENWVYSKSSHETYSETMHYGWEASQGSDGSANSKRNMDRADDAETTFSKRSTHLINNGAEDVAKEIVGPEGAKDDFILHGLEISMIS